MKRKTCTLIILCLLISTLTLAQNKILTTDGKTLTANVVKISHENISANVDGEIIDITKHNILAVIINGRPAYTFRVKNGKKITFKKKDMRYNYIGADKPRMYAYKYQGSPSNVSQLYMLNGDSSMNEEQFKNIFIEQQMKFKSRNAVGYVAMGVAILAGVASISLAKNEPGSAFY